MAARAHYLLEWLIVICIICVRTNRVADCEAMKLSIYCGLVPCHAPGTRIYVQGSYHALTTTLPRPRHSTCGGMRLVKLYVA